MIDRLPPHSAPGVLVAVAYHHGAEVERRTLSPTNVREAAEAQADLAAAGAVTGRAVAVLGV